MVDKWLSHYVPRGTNTSKFITERVSEAKVLTFDSVHQLTESDGNTGLIPFIK
jgi:hypothetical protein